MKKIFLGNFRIGYRARCGTCSEGKRLRSQCDAAEISEKMIAADVIGMAFPVYFHMVALG